MDFAALNWFAILACTLASMVIGAVWNNPKTFFNVWWNVVGAPDKKPGGANMALLWASTVIASFMKALALALLLPMIAPYTGGLSLGGFLGAASLLWVGVIAPTYLVNKLFAGHGLLIWGIETGNHLADFLVFAVILGLWR